MRHDVGRILMACVVVGTSVPVFAEPGLRPVGSRVASPPRVRPGIDVLLTDSIALIAGRRLGLITNQAGVDARGIPTIDRLSRLATTPDARLPAPRLVALFAAEHGIRGTAEPGVLIDDAVDAATGVPIYSLYGANRAPTADQLAGLDLLVVDLPDVGARPFTYISTVIVSMRAAAAAGKRVIVLDRPNPIGCRMQGPVLDSAYTSFIGMLPVPLRHGLTIGELARFANAVLAIGADLVVVPVQGWRRCQWFDETGLPWVRPSPNLPDLEALAWYPGTVLFEATNLSVGRGTDAPFRQIGAPWLEPAAPIQLLRFYGHAARRVTFTPSRPGDGKFDGVTVQGLRFPASRHKRDDPVALAMLLMDQLAAQRADSFRLDTLGLFRRLGVRVVPGRTGVCNALDCDRAGAFRWDDQINAFRRRVRPHLLYE